MYKLQPRRKKSSSGLESLFNRMFYPIVALLVLISIALIIANIEIRQVNILGFILLAMPVVLAALAIWAVGKKSTACGVTLGLVIVIVGTVIAILFLVPQWFWLFI